MAVNLIQSKEHLSPEGLRKIIAIKASMNSGGVGVYPYITNYK